MRLRLQLFFDSLRYSLTFMPMVLALLGLGMAFGSLQLDRAAPAHSGSFLLYSGGPDGARALLSVAASSVLSVAALAFSIAIAALALAAGQFGSRLLRNFLDDAAFQWTLGTFAGTFLFCLVILRATRSQDEGGVFVPQISVSIALGLTVICVLLLSYFLNHVAASIQAPHVAFDAAKDLHHEIDRLFRVGQKQKQRGKPEIAPGLRFQTPIFGARDAYIVAINYEALIEIARQNALVFAMQVRPGDFALTNAPLLRVAGAKILPDLEKDVRRTFILGRARSPLQDAEYGINQLVEVAVRALSPAINDPFTANTCLDHLGAALRHVLRLELPSPFLLDKSGEVRVIARVWTFGGLCDAAFNMIRQYGRDSASVSIHLLETLENVARECRTAEEKQVIAHHAQMTRRDCQSEIPGAADQQDLEARLTRVLAALEENSRKPPPAPSA